jgi:hypothetical protein
MNQKTEEVHGMVLSDIRYLDINKIGNVNRVKHFLTLLHNFYQPMHLVNVGHNGSRGNRNEGKLDNKKISCNFSNRSSRKCT